MYAPVYHLVLTNNFKTNEVFFKKLWGYFLGLLAICTSRFIKCLSKSSRCFHCYLYFAHQFFLVLYVFGIQKPFINYMYGKCLFSLCNLPFHFILKITVCCFHKSLWLSFSVCQREKTLF